MIRLRGVRKTYASPAGPVEAVAGVSCDIAEGEFVSILGPSGCGKSTLLMMMAGLESVSAGSIEIGGKPLEGPRRDAGLVFQDATLLPWLSARDNVLFPIKMMRLPRDEYVARAEELLRSVGLADFMDKRPRELSGGMRQRVALCRSLIHQPSIMLMDEPFSALDAITRDEMALVLLDLWSRHRKTGIFITHSIREAVLLSDRVLVMTRRPAVVVADIRIPFERPRDETVQDSAEFIAIVARLRGMIEHSIREAA
ncbi:ABC transporter ATP-binding protein [Roseococcus sp. YIM B11640]|uniref:ABC transporter ATP-binding protein n=1 Tax=Roseococcus sp. YIM B11640 TaxID=3133973 RepID=UPI003C7D0241